MRIYHCHSQYSQNYAHIKLSKGSLTQHTDDCLNESHGLGNGNPRRERERWPLELPKIGKVGKYQLKCVCGNHDQVHKSQ